MKVMCSACLLGSNCKYNGGNNYNEKLADYLKDHEVVAVCPECLGGLPTPRVPAEIVNGTVMNAEGVSVDEQFRRGAEQALAIGLRENVDLVVLQSRSPSCGVKQIYDGSFEKRLIEGQGVFAKLCCKAGLKVVDLEDVDSIFEA